MYRKQISHKAFQYDPNEHIVSVCFLDSFIFVSVHFSSPKDPKWPAVEAFMRHLLDLKDTFQHLHIVGGGDFNRDIHNVPKDIP